MTCQTTASPSSPDTILDLRDRCPCGHLPDRVGVPADLATMTVVWSLMMAGFDLSDGQSDGFVWLAERRIV